MSMSLGFYGDAHFRKWKIKRRLAVSSSKDFYFKNAEEKNNLISKDSELYLRSKRSGYRNIEVIIFVAKEKKNTKKKTNSCKVSQAVYQCLCSKLADINFVYNGRFVSKYRSYRLGNSRLKKNNLDSDLQRSRFSQNEQFRKIKIELSTRRIRLGVNDMKAIHQK